MFGLTPINREKLSVGDKVIILSGAWTGYDFKITHISKDGKWAYSGNYNYPRMRTKNLEKKVQL